MAGTSERIFRYSFDLPKLKPAQEFARVDK